MVPVIAAHDAMVEKSESYVRGSERTIYAAPPGGAGTRFLSRSAARQLRRMLDGQHVGDIHSARSFAIAMGERIIPQPFARANNRAVPVRLAVERTRHLPEFRGLGRASQRSGARRKRVAGVKVGPQQPDREAPCFSGKAAPA
jgi:hypothetical protein